MENIPFQHRLERATLLRLRGRIHHLPEGEGPGVRGPPSVEGQAQRREDSSKNGVEIVAHLKVRGRGRRRSRSPPFVLCRHPRTIRAACHPARRRALPRDGRNRPLSDRRGPAGETWRRESAGRESAPTGSTRTGSGAGARRGRNLGAPSSTLGPLTPAPLPPGEGFARNMQHLRDCAHPAVTAPPARPPPRSAPPVPPRRPPAHSWFAD